MQSDRYRLMQTIVLNKGNENFEKLPKIFYLNNCKNSLPTCLSFNKSLIYIATIIIQRRH